MVADVAAGPVAAVVACLYCFAIVARVVAAVVYSAGAMCCCLLPLLLEVLLLLPPPCFPDTLVAPLHPVCRAELVSPQRGLPRQLIHSP